jgi:hypothetical protein
MAILKNLRWVNLGKKEKALLPSEWVHSGENWRFHGLFSVVFLLSWGWETWHDFGMRKIMRLPDTYRFPGFRPVAVVRGLFGDPKARIVSLQRRRKKRPVASAANRSGPITTASSVGSATCRAATRACTWSSRFDASNVAGVVP